MTSPRLSGSEPETDIKKDQVNSCHRPIAMFNIAFSFSSGTEGALIIRCLGAKNFHNPGQGWSKQQTPDVNTEVKLVPPGT